MNEATIEEFLEAIKDTHGAQAQLASRERVVERFQGETVWEGEVLIFDLEGHEAPRCYAWEVDGEVTAVLHSGPIDSPVKAVRASILAPEIREVAMCGRCGHRDHLGPRGAVRCSEPRCDCGDWSPDRCPGALGETGDCPGREAGGHTPGCPALPS